MRKRAYLITILSLLAGLALFVYVIRQAGSQELLTRVRSIGPGFLWIIFISGLRPAVRAWAWLRCMSAADRRVGFFTVWRARLIGDAIGNLTTAGPLLAEPARLVFFSGRMPFAHAASSLSVEFLSYFISCCVMMLAGVGVLLATFALSPSLRQASLLALGALLVILVAVIVVFSRRWSPVTALRKLIRRVIGRHRFGHQIDHQFHHLHKLEKHIFDFYRQRPRDFAAVCLCEAGFHLLGVTEMWVMLRLIGGQPGWVASFIFEAVNRLINFAFAFVPVKVGVDEAGTALLAQALGFGALAGVTMAVYRKLRVLFWTLLGLIFLALPHRRHEVK
ncbi:MAG TPA: lysylphosphatidylglycerol synthase transmembrane domain-containing protein [Blastocatellia bacterium]|nr:lysylphosphatidylglycerol synthase transmembrane domain-containing protein [Blastocatellia bacterium]